MGGHGRALRLGEYLIRRACQHLPLDAREERYREWAAELPCILADPAVRAAPLRTPRMLLFAADHIRGTRSLPRPRAAVPRTARA
jgi:hypothetical protein